MSDSSLSLCHFPILAERRTERRKKSERASDRSWQYRGERMAVLRVQIGRGGGGGDGAGDRGRSRGRDEAQKSSQDIKPPLTRIIERERERVDRERRFGKLALATLSCLEALAGGDPRRQSVQASERECSAYARAAAVNSPLSFIGGARRRTDGGIGDGQGKWNSLANACVVAFALFSSVSSLLRPSSPQSLHRSLYSIPLHLLFLSRFLPRSRALPPLSEPFSLRRCLLPRPADSQSIWLLSGWPLARSLAGCTHSRRCTARKSRGDFLQVPSLPTTPTAPTSGVTYSARRRTNAFIQIILQEVRTS